jgi:dihydrolipoamide dehydrogenase
LPADALDVVVLGGGFGGYTAAIRGSQLGLKVALVEEARLGGTCLHWGCIPTKALLESSELLYKVRDRGKEFGVNTQGLVVDYPTIDKRKDAIVNQLTRGIEGLMRKNKIEVVSTHATVRGKNTIRAGDRELEAKHLIIATGSTPRLLPGIEVDGKRIITSDDAVHADRLPASVAIIGGGAIGVEFATFYHQMGVEKVVLIEALDRLVPLEDEEVSAVMLKAFQKMGVDVRVGAKVQEAKVQEGKPGEDGVMVKVDGGELKVEQLLVAVGRAPRSNGIGLAEVGLKLNKQGFVEVDEWMRTGVDSIHAIGDLVGGYQLAHAAVHEGVTAAEDIAGQRFEPVKQELITRCTYSHPQIASVGLTEKQAVDKGIKVKVGKFPFVAIARALIHGESDGFVKIVADDTGRVLGTHIVGAQATELIAEPSLAQLFQGDAWEIGRNVHPHPTLSEAIGEAAMAVDGHALNI